ncbi:hypothetical protein [Thiosulfativibrio zosterae]|uniref:Uncharacterized protein n=1 Tax=Thiosulfativibrio zosterae TaxID=2675053 RepID=A0A6F8PJJ0_9GAMM|nr:hypothetical protein [Thiosulfativibrio zosterae]BBP42262.1 hypothetical protein THMIRHAT_00080 [Thiosulfativibrio zosterae]
MEYDFRIILNDDAIIIDYEDPQNFLGYGTQGETVRGENWLSLFIDTSDFKKVMDAFVRTFSGEAEQYVHFQNDVLTAKKNHKYIDFHNRLIEIDGKPCLESFGFEHFKGRVAEFKLSD